MAIENKTYTAVVVLNKNNEMFLLKRRAGHHIGCFEFPAGKGEAGERPVHTAMREFYEETGSRIKNPATDLHEFMVVTTMDQNGKPIKWTNFYYVIRDISLSSPPKVNEPETHSVGEWFSIDQLNDLDVVNMTGLCIPVIQFILKTNGWQHI